jgi:hypothetical protein
LVSVDPVHAFPARFFGNKSFENRSRAILLDHKAGMKVAVFCVDIELALRLIRANMRNC